MASSQRVLAVIIAALLVGGVVTAVVKSPETKTSAEPIPTQTYTFPGPAPTESETPIIPPTETPTPEVSPTKPLPNTGTRGLAGPALAALAIAFLAGLAVRRSGSAVR